MPNFKALFVWLIVLVSFDAQLRAALSGATAWEIRPTVGADTNGGGFVAGATGTDRSQADAAFCTATDLAVTTTAATSATCPFSSTSVGNLIQITAGGCTAGFYQVVSVAVVTATLDRTAGTATGCTFALGGALATLATALTASVNQNRLYIKDTGVLTSTATNNLTSNFQPSNAAPYNVLQGYGTTRGDTGRARITLSTNTSLTAIATAAGWIIQNLVIDCSSLGSSTGINLGAFSTARNVKVSNCTSRNILVAGNNSSVEDSEITGCTSACDGALYMLGQNTALRNWVHNNAAFGIRAQGADSPQIQWNLVTNITGATNDCIYLNSGNPVNALIMNNTTYACGQDGLRFESGLVLAGSTNVRNNIFVNAGRYGFNGAPAAGLGAWPMFDGNFYFNNATANRNNMDDTGATNAINAVAPYTNVLDVTLSVDPFTNAAGDNFTLNSTAGGGAAVKAAGTPGPLPGIAQSGYIDGGALQSQAASGGGCTGACAIR